MDTITIDYLTIDFDSYFLKIIFSNPQNTDVEVNMNTGESPNKYR